ncbi:MAG: response regulator [Huintestinicola sp.]|uniref:response regulator n=1 Tax=Huintestinicola sp. TaxID=2981661 RepID=UPI003F0E5EFD
MIYNIYFEAAAICYLIILNMYIRLQYNNTSKQNKLFQRLAVYLLVAVSLDVLTAVTISYAAHIPVWLNMILNHAYNVSVLVLEYHFLIYCIEGVCRRKPEGKFFQICRWLNIIANIILVINLFTGCVFSFTPEGEYIHGPLYYMTYSVSLVFIFAATGVLLSESKRFNTNQKVTIILYCVTSLIGPAVQLVLPDVLFCLFTVSLGFVMLMFSMETPDYQQLTKTMEELASTRDEAEEAMGLAQAANQAKTDFLSAMSHELRTPINSILGFNEMIMQQTNDTEIRKCTDNVQTAGMNLLSIISNILDYTEIEGGRLKITESPYSTRSMLRDVLAYAEYGTDKSQLELRTDIDENIPSELSGDITRVIQVFNNVISNAVKYTYRGYVEISVKWIPDEGGDTGLLSARISDSGVGIRKEDLARLSQSFTRLDKKKNQNIQGVGLGLSIVTKLLSLMGGSISIDSEYEKGTTVSFELRQQVISSIPAGKISPLGSGDINTDDSYKFYIPDAKILTVDDNGMNRELFKGLLRDSGADIDAVSGGREAISMLEKNSYDIIFLDHMMPEMDGIETLRVIKDRGLSDAPVAVLTANTVAGAREMYLAEGFDDYLAKPVTGRMLYGILKKYLPAGMIKELPRDIPDTTEEKNAPRRKRSVMERLGQFLDTATGLTYCCEDEGFYISMLETYLENSRLEDMKNFYEEKDYDNYRITVHSVKSTSLTIGAAELSGEAKGLEMAQKSGDIGYIEENHQRVYEMYGEMLQKIKAVLDDPDDILGGEETKEERISRILIVDDDPSCLAIAKRTLETKFEVITAGSGDEALKILRKDIPDLAVLDIYMPEMDGFELMKRIRELCDVPVVFLTADSDKSLEERCFDRGAMDFITKPVTSTILINRLSRVIELDELKKRVS